MTEATELATADFDEWDEFVASCPEGSPFHTAWWHNAWSADFQILGVRNKEGKLVAGMPVCSTNFLGRSALRPPPLTPLNAPLVHLDAGAKRVALRSTWRTNTLAVLQALPDFGSYHLFYGDDIPDPQPFSETGFDSSAAWTYVIPKGEVDSWRSEMSSSRRRKLKKAAKQATVEEIHVSTEISMADVAPFLVDTADRKGYSNETYAALVPAWWEAVSERGMGTLYGLMSAKGILLGATVLVHGQSRSWYLGGGMLPRIRDNSDLNMLLFERMIDDTLQAGRDFDFEGSTIPGVDRFFREFGGELRPTSRFVRLSGVAPFAAWQLHGFWTRHRRGANKTRPS